VTRLAGLVAMLAVATGGPLRLAAAEGPAALDAGAATAPLEARIEPVAGEPVSGRLLEVGADGVRLEVQGAERLVPLATVRQLVRVAGAAAQDGPAALLLTTTDGGTLSGSDFLQEGPRGVVAAREGRIELPVERIRRVAWLAPDEREPGWVAKLPERPESDLLVVRRDEGEEFVACAVVGVSGEHVTVVLDGETIPVKRAKVRGIEWLREEAPAGGTVVRLAGGQLTARSIRWSDAAFTLDDIRLPPDSFKALDFAAGRTTSLAALEPETSTVEPFFGGLAADRDLAAFFAPRVVAAADGGPADLLVRPRTVATWRVPEASRRFRGTVARHVASEATAAVEVVLAVDGREAWRRRLAGVAGSEPEPVAFDLDVAMGRRVTLTVDFVAGDPGCGIRLAGGAFEK